MATSSLTRADIEALCDVPSQVLQTECSDALANAASNGTVPNEIEARRQEMDLLRAVILRQDKEGGTARLQSALTGMAELSKYESMKQVARTGKEKIAAVRDATREVAAIFANRDAFGRAMRQLLTEIDRAGTNGKAHAKENGKPAAAKKPVPKAKPLPTGDPLEDLAIEEIGPRPETSVNFDDIVINEVPAPGAVVAKQTPQ